MCDDLNTPNALSELYAEIKVLNQSLRMRPLNLDSVKGSLGKLNDYLNILGIQVPYPVLSDEDKALYKAYMDAKAAKDFAKSDELRALLSTKGIL